jgi:hypothetical protein
MRETAESPSVMVVALPQLSPPSACDGSSVPVGRVRRWDEQRMSSAGHDASRSGNGSKPRCLECAGARTEAPAPGRPLRSSSRDQHSTTAAAGFHGQREIVLARGPAGELRAGKVEVSDTADGLAPLR